MFSISVYIIVLCVVYVCMFALWGLCVHECMCLHRMWRTEVGIGVFLVYSLPYIPKVLYDPEFSDLASQAR